MADHRAEAQPLHGRQGTRKQKQWEYLARPLDEVVEDPGSRECLEKRLAALEKVQATCRKRLEELDAAEHDAKVTLGKAKKKKKKRESRKKGSSTSEAASSYLAGRLSWWLVLVPSCHQPNKSLCKRKTPWKRKRKRKRRQGKGKALGKGKR